MFYGLLRVLLATSARQVVLSSAISFVFASVVLVLFWPIYAQNQPLPKSGETRGKDNDGVVIIFN